MIHKSHYVTIPKITEEWRNAFEKAYLELGGGRVQQH